LPVVGQSLQVTPDLEGLNIRVRAVYKDANGVLENVYSAETADVLAGVAPGPVAALPAESSTTSPGMHLIRSDLQFILDSIKIAEQHAAGADLLSLLPHERSRSSELPDEFAEYLRTGGPLPRPPRFWLSCGCGPFACRLRDRHDEPAVHRDVSSPRCGCCRS
jgi:hypothetical protein